MDLTADAPAAHRPAVAQIVPSLASAAGAVVALALGLLLLDRRTLTVEEAVGAAAAGDRLGDVVESDPARAGYAALLDVVTRVDGGETALRLVSVAAAVVAAALACALGALLLGRLGGVLTSILLATNAAVVSLSQQARPFALALAAIVLSTLLLVVALERGRAWWIAYAAAALILPLAHPLAASALLAHGAAIAVRRSEIAWRWAAPALGFAAVETGLLVAAAAVDRNAAADATGGLGAGELGRALVAAAGWSPVLIAAAVAGVALVAAGKVERVAPWVAVLVGGLIASPPLVTVLVAPVLPVFPEPAFVLSAPGLALGAAAALVAIPRREATVVLAALGVLAAVWIATWYSEQPAEDWRAAARSLRAELMPSESVVVVPAGARAALAHYAPGVRPADEARGSAAWVLVRAAPEDAIDLARSVVATPRFALLEQRPFGTELALQRWVRP